MSNLSKVKNLLLRQITDILESCTAFNGTSLSNFMLSESVKFIYTLAYCYLMKPYFIIYSIYFEEGFKL
jgi:hypothetical protein